MHRFWRMIRREAVHYFHFLNPASRRKAAEWDNTVSIDFLRKLGVKEGDVVADIGCGPGRFCIPAARIAGAGGAVYAVDTNQSVLDKVRRKADILNLGHLYTISSVDELAVQMNGRKCNVLLLYDMLHLMDLQERRKLYDACHALLAEKAVLSAHLKHMRNDEPAGNFAALSAEAVVREIEASGYALTRKIEATIWHSHAMANGTVWTFTRKTRGKV